MWFEYWIFDSSYIIYSCRLRGRADWDKLGLFFVNSTREYICNSFFLEVQNSTTSRHFDRCDGVRSQAFLYASDWRRSFTRQKTKVLLELTSQFIDSFLSATFWRRGHIDGTLSGDCRIRCQESLSPRQLRQPTRQKKAARLFAASTSRRRINTPPRPTPMSVTTTMGFRVWVCFFFLFLFFFLLNWHHYICHHPPPNASGVVRFIFFFIFSCFIYTNSYIYM